MKLFGLELIKTLLNLYIKKQNLNIFTKIFPSLLIVLNITACSISNKEKNTQKTHKDYHKEMVNIYSKAITNYPNNFYFHLERGKARQDLGDFKGAIDDFNHSLAINPNKRFLFYRANAKFDYGDYGGAIKDYENSISLKEFKDQVFYNLAVLQYINFNYKDAITNYSKSIMYDNDYNSYLKRGDAKYKIMDYLGSLDDYSKSIEINKDSYITFNNRGVIKFKLSKYKEALKDFEKSLKINPKNYNTLYNKAITNSALKEKKKACIDLKKSIKLGKEVFEDEYSKICK